MKSSKEWTNKEIENHLAHLFSSNCCRLLNFDNPEIKNSESPDFILGRGEKFIGLEITRALDQNLKKAVEIRNDNFKDVAFCPTSFEDKDMSGKEIKKEFGKLGTQLTGRPYKGNELEEKAICNIITAIQKKIEKFADYTKYDKNILLVHSNDVVTLDHNFVTIKIREHVSKNNVLFDYIVLKLGNVFYFFSEGKYFSCNIKI